MLRLSRVALEYISGRRKRHHGHFAFLLGTAALHHIEEKFAILDPRLDKVSGRRIMSRKTAAITEQFSRTAMTSALLGPRESNADMPITHGASQFGRGCHRTTQGSHLPDCRRSRKTPSGRHGRWPPRHWHLSQNGQIRKFVVTKSSPGSGRSRCELDCSNTKSNGP